ncbi:MULTISPECIES: dual specificity protein phosphatase family protein [Roseiflexus]|uniref:Dual specificity protein phosphatase n=1 Tax=Roseiflexus castenholzii (strain DSM 13941 / HLO8) TaxID=383372 RepID=A7NQY1_ROSCS|nr:MULTISPECIES: dual specificity protein phosphatase [Roseiflexus]ABU59977.1 dual specificity protein phosphatase [Roseiflexus castenholzii DSM 13941]
MMTEKRSAVDDLVVPKNGIAWLWRYTTAQWNRLFGLNVSRLDDLLYVGGEFHAGQWPHLRALGIRAVLSLQAEREDVFEGPPPDRVLRLEVVDFHPPTIEQLRRAVAFVSAAHADGLPTLIHCHAGVGRAPLTTAAYLVAQGMTSSEALEQVRRARPIIGLNERQMQRLIEWEQAMRG